LFELENFDMKLNTEFIGRNFIYVDEIESTNNFLLDKKNNFSKNGTVILAEKQSKGRGRKDRVWYSAKDQNLTFSILINDQKYFKENFNLINFAASLAIANAIENLFPLRTELKWPNDVLINSKKTAGILIDSVSQGSQVERVVIGFGINVNQNLFQGSFNFPPTSIRMELNENIEREKLLSEVLNNFEEIIEKISKDPEAILKEWKNRCRMIGEKISVIEGDDVRYGIFDDIDDKGFLLLKTKNSIERVHFGDVTLR
jgi:BirA family transcriptional regulator, biotin operon repressor / biotin---[acetyl-CoA-carboxylase] ligase